MADHQVTSIVKFISYKNKIERSEIKRIEGALGTMGRRILHLAQAYAPVDTGALRDDGRVQRDSEGAITVAFGGLSVPYARRRHYENNKNPQTKLYLERAGDQISKQGLDLS